MSSTPALQERSRRWRDFLWVVPFTVVGTALRLAWLGRQVASGDELHAVRVVLTEPLLQVLVTYHGSDNCLPLSAVYRALVGLGVPLSEMVMRLPVVLSSIAAVAVIPLIVERVTSRWTALVLGWMLAVWPPLVLYGRIIRPYGSIVLLGFASVAMFWWWARRPSVGRGAAAGFLAALTGYFHLGALPFVLAPLVFFTGELLLALVSRRLGAAQRDAPCSTAGTGVHAPLAASVSLPALVAAGLWSALCCLTFILPAWPSLSRLIELKHITSPMTGGTYRALLRLQSGSSEVMVTWVFWILAVVGLILLLRRSPRLGLYSLTLMLGQVVGLHVMSPLALNNPLIFNRYMLVSLPVVLGWVAVALSLDVSKREPPLAVRAVLASAWLVVSVVTGPLADPWTLRSSFAHSSESLYFIRDFKQATELPALSIYEALRDDLTPGAVIEYPYHTMWRYARVASVYQRTHRREVIVAPTEPLLWDPRLAFRNMLPSAPERFLGSRAGFVVVHLDPESEESALDSVRTGRAQPRRAGKRRDDASRRAAQLEKQARHAERIRDTLEASWGPPDLATETILVWNLERVRHPRQGS